MSGTTAGTSHTLLTRENRESLMAADVEPGKNNQPKTRTALTLKTKNRIKELVGKCEYCDVTKSPAQLEVYQLSPIARPEHRKEDSPQNTLIVLCKEHHIQVSDGKISKFSLKSKIAKRSDKKKKELRSVLMKQERTYEGSGVTRVRDPRSFNVFLQEKSDRRP